MASIKNKKCQMCQTSFKARRDAKTCSATCRKRLQRILQEKPKASLSRVETAVSSEFHRLARNLLSAHVIHVPVPLSDERGSIQALPIKFDSNPKPEGPSQIEVRQQGQIYKPEVIVQSGPNSDDLSSASSGVNDFFNGTVPVAESPKQAGVTSDQEPASVGTVAPIKRFEESEAYPSTPVKSIWSETILKFRHRWVLLAAMILLVLFPLGGGFLILNSKSNGGQNNNGGAGPLALSDNGIKNSTINKNDKFSVNLTLEAKNTLIISPTPKPDNLEKGQIFLDQTSNKLFYYDGEKLHDLGDSSTVINNNIQGPTNITNSTIVNSFVQTGVTELSGTTNQINVSSGTGNVTLSLPQDIATTSTPTFAGLNLGSALQVSSGGTGTTTFATNSLLLGNGAGAIQTTNVGTSGQCLIVNGSGVPTFQGCAAGGGVFAGGSQTPGTLTKFDTTTDQIVDSLVSESGSTITANGDLSVTGTISGNGSGLTSLDATSLASGTVASARLTGLYTGITGVGNLDTGSIISGFGTISTGNNITTSATIQGGIVNATSTLQLNGVNINTAGTLSNVAYLNQDQTFTGHNIFKNSSDSTTAFQIQNLAGTSNLFVADTINNRIGIGTLGPGYSLDVQSGDINTTGLYRVNGAQISSANLSNDSNLAKINGANIFTATNTFSGTVSIQGANTLTLGTASNVGSIIFHDGTSANTATLQVAGALSGDVTFGLPVTTGAQTICTVEAGNCAGSGSGVTTSGGTPGRLAVFTGSQALGDSSIADDGVTVTVTVGQVIQGSAGLTIGDTGVNGQLAFKNSSNANTLTLQSGVTTSDLTLTLPTGDGANGDCLQTNGSGVLVFSACTGGAGGGVTSVNTLTGVLNLVGTANQVDVSSAGDTITLSLPQDINTSGNANFRTITLTGQAAGDNLIVGNAVSGATGTLLDLQVNNVSKLTVDASGNVNTTGQYQVNGSQISSADLSNDSNLAKLDGTGPQVFTGDNKFTGTVLTQLDSPTAFQIQNGAGTSNLLVADTTTTRIGIGTDTPGYTLDVNGDINTSGVYRINGVTVCSASGCTAASGSGSYIQNGTAPQTADFNITGTGEVGGIFTAGAGGKTAITISDSGAQNSGLTIGGDTNLYRGAAGELDTDSALNVNGAYIFISGPGSEVGIYRDGYIQPVTSSVSDLVFNTAVYTEAFGRMSITADGSIYWGGGSAPSDTKLYRSAAGVLKTDGTFNAVTAYQLNGVNINTAGTLNNVAYLNASNNFTGTTNTFSATGGTSLAVTGAPTNSATSSLIQIGNAISGGNSSANGGTYIGLNAPSSGPGSAADLINLETNGTSRFKVDTSGNVNANGNIVVNTNSLTNGAFSKSYTAGTGGVSVNDVVVMANDSGNARVIDTTTPRDIRVIGVAASTVSSGTTFTVRILGSFQVTADTGAVAIGDQLVTSSTSGQVTVDNNATTGILGYATSTKSAGSSGLVSVYIRPVGGQSTPRFQNASNSTTAFQIQNAAGTSNLLIADTTNTRIAIGQATANVTLDVAGSINSTTGINTGASGGTQRIDASGNLVNIGNITGSGNITIGGAGISGGVTIQSALNSGYFRVNNSSGTAELLVDTTNNRTCINCTTANGALDVKLGVSNTQLLNLRDNSNVVVTSVSSTGATTFQNTANSTTAFQIQNSAGTSNLFVADTTNTRLGVGTASPNTTLSVYNGNESTTQTDFTQSLNKGGINIITDFTDTSYTPGIFWSTQDNNATKPKAGIYMYEDSASGTSLLFGTSGAYATGITNTALTLNAKGGAIFKNGTNDTTGFQVQNSTGTGLFTVNTSTGAALTTTLFIDTLGSGGTTALCWNGSFQVSSCASTGSIGFWNRTGTTLSPATSGDNITTSGNISTSGSGAITAAGTLTANGQSVVIQPSSSLTAGQTNVSQTITNASSSGGTINGYSQSITISNTSSASTTNGMNISLTDNASSLGNQNNGISISLAGSNSTRGDLGIDATVAKGIGIRSISTGSGGNGTLLCNSVSIGLGICAGETAGSNAGGGIYAYTNSRATSNIYDPQGTGVYGITQATGTAGAFYGGIKGIANQSANNAYTSTGVYGKGKGGTSATVYGGYFTLDSASTATAGAALYASNSTTTANILQLQDNTTDVFVVADGGNVTAAGDVQIQGGDLTTNQTTFNLLSTNATTINFGDAATTALNIGPGGATAATINIAGGSGATGCTVAGASGNLTCSGNIISGSNQAFVQNGNSMGATAVLGTNDSNSLAFETNNVTKWLINTTGDFLPNANDTYNIGSDTARVANLYLGGETLHIGSSTSDEAAISYNNTTDSLLFKNATNSTTALQLQDKDANVLLTADTTTNKRVNIVGDVNVGSRYGNRLFSDNFESNSFNLWDQGTGGTISLDTATVHAGKYSAKINPAGAAAYADATISANTTTYIRAWVNVTSQTSGNADILSLYYDGTHYWTLYRNGGAVHIYNGVTNSDAGSGGSFTTSTWHLLEMRVTTGAGTGTSQAWLDGTLVVNATSQNNGTNNPNIVEIGDSNSRTFTAYIDDVAVDTATTGTASSLNVDDSLHTGGSGSFGGPVLIQSTSSAPDLSIQAATGNGATARINADDNNVASLQLMETNDRGFNLYYDGNPNQFVIQANDAGTLSDVVTIQRTDGSVVFQNSADSTTAFQVQDQNDNPILYVDTTNAAVRIKGTGANGGGGRLQFGDGDLTGSQNAWVGEHGTGDSDQLQLQGANGVYITGQYDGSVEIANFFSDTTGIYGTGVNALAVAQFNSRAVFGYDGSTQDAIVQGNSGKGFRLYTDGNDSTTRSTFSVDTDGAALFQNYNNTTAAFQIQNTSNQNLFQVDTSNNNIVIGGNNSGALQTWQTNANALPAARQNATTVTANGYIYVIGGSTAASSSSTCGTALTTASYAKLNADGSVGSWGSTTALPNPRCGATSVAANGYVYVIGGVDNAPVTNSTVYYAKTNADGTLGSWNTNSNALPAVKDGSTSAVANGYMYVIDGEGGWNGSGGNNLYYAKLNADGSTGSWTNTTGPRASLWASAVTANGYLYVIGGYASETEVDYAQLNPTTGAPGTWNTTTSLPAGRWSATTVIANGYMYVLSGFGGSYLGNAVSSVYYAPLNSNGTVGSWVTDTNTMPTSQGFSSSVIANGYIYEIGGESYGAGSGTVRSTVYYSSTQRIKIGGSLDLVGLGGGNGLDGGSIGQGSAGGNLTAGDTRIMGSLQVQGQVSLSSSLSVGGTITANGNVTFQPNTDSTTAFRIQNSASTANLFTADTSGLVITIAGTTSTFANLTLTNAHFKSTQTTKPTIGTPSGCGTSPSATVANNSTDSAGSITITTGTGSPANCATIVTFNKAYGAAPKAVLLTDTFGNAGINSYAQSPTTTTFTANLKGTIPASTAFTIYYWVVE